MNELEDENNDMNNMDDADLLDMNNDNEEGEQEDNDSHSDNRFEEVDEGGWVQWFCQLDSNKYLCEISPEFLTHKTNIFGIDTKGFIPMISSPDKPSQTMITDEYLDKLSAVKEVYGLLHKRFIRTPEGLVQMREKFLNGIFGRCPRILCEKQLLLPLGLSEDLKYSRLRVFCPLCQEVYEPNKRIHDIDGAFYGTDYPQFFLSVYPDLNPKHKSFKKYVQRVHGFKVFGKYGSKYYRENKRDIEELMKKLNVDIGYNLYY